MLRRAPNAGQQGLWEGGREVTQLLANSVPSCNPLLKKTDPPAALVHRSPQGALG